MPSRRLMCCRAAVGLVLCTPALAEIGPVFKVGGLSARYTGTAGLFTVTGTDQPLFWRPPGQSGFSPYGTNASFSLTATSFSWSTPTANAAASEQVSLRVEDRLNSLTLATCEGAGYLHHGGSAGVPDKAGPGLFVLSPTGGTLNAQYPFTLTWAEGTTFDQVFVDWTRIYTGTVEAWFYWAVPEPSTMGLCAIGGLILSSRRFRGRSRERG